MNIVYSMGHMTFPQHRVHSDMVAQFSTEEELRNQFQRGDAILVLEGGADINPSIYAAENTYSYFNVSRDAWEIFLYSLAKEYNVPVLGICRGHQLVAALEGGTLFQDLAMEHGLDHAYRHEITLSREAIECGFRTLMASCPLGRSNVNSLHHQGIRFMPPSGVPLARSAPDSLVEAVLYPRALTMQWHPELLRHMEVLDYMSEHFGV